MLVTNPHNPLGTTVSRSTLRGYCDFAQKHDLHLVSDEIYAMSVYENKGGLMFETGHLPFVRLLICSYLIRHAGCQAFYFNLEHRS